MTGSERKAGEVSREGVLRTGPLPQTPGFLFGVCEGGHTTDPVPLAQALIRCASVTPADDGAQNVLAQTLTNLGFSVTRLKFGEIENIFTRIGTTSPHVCFAGHTDVVPVGAAWRHAPFAADIADGKVFGRGACDMKGAIAAFVTACARHVQAGAPAGSISLLITGDEEGDAHDGTVRVLPWMAENGHIPDVCVVGEPTNPTVLGEMIKIGRRGSLNASVTVRGTQGHVAYPHRADNPVHRLLAALHELIAKPLDNGTDFFEASSLQVTSVDVGNAARNVIAGEAAARINIRFNDLHTGASLTQHLHGVLARHCADYSLDVAISGEAFLTTPSDAVAVLQAAILRHTGRVAKLDTGGGTSDARFIARYCPVFEFGLVGASMHKTDEHVDIADLETLTSIYQDFLRDMLPANAAGTAP